MILTGFGDLKAVFIAEDATLDTRFALGVGLASNEPCGMPWRRSLTLFSGPELDVDEKLSVLEGAVYIEEVRDEEEGDSVSVDIRSTSRFESVS